jgi:hypothetical protein
MVDHGTQVMASRLVRSNRPESNALLRDAAGGRWRSNLASSRTALCLSGSARGGGSLLIWDLKGSRLVSSGAALSLCCSVSSIAIGSSSECRGQVGGVEESAIGSSSSECRSQDGSVDEGLRLLHLTLGNYCDLDTIRLSSLRSERYAT